MVPEGAGASRDEPDVRPDDVVWLGTKPLPDGSVFKARILNFATARCVPDAIVVVGVSDHLERVRVVEVDGRWVVFERLTG